MANLTTQKNSADFTGTVALSQKGASEPTHMTWYTGDNNDPSNVVVAGTARSIRVMISDWGNTPNAKFLLYEADGDTATDTGGGPLLAQVTVPASVGSGLLTIDIPDVSVAAGLCYILAVIPEPGATSGDNVLTLYANTGGDSLWRGDLSGTYQSPNGVMPDKSALVWVGSNEIFFELHDTSASDTTAPVLSNQSVTPGWKTVDPQCDTDDTSSDVFCAIALATAPAPADGDAIIDGTYTDAVATVSATPSATTVTLPQVTGLTPNTQYVAYFASRDADGNTSAVVSATFTTLSATATFAITGAVNETDWTVILFDGAVSDNPNKLKAVGTTGPDASGNLVVNLDDVSVTDTQAIEGLAVDASTDKPIPLRGTVSIA